MSMTNSQQVGNKPAEDRLVHKIRFEMKDLGHAKKILGMEIYRDRSKGILHLSLSSYIDRIVSKFGLSSASWYSTCSSYVFIQVPVSFHRFRM